MASVILAAEHVGAPPWPTYDPFLFCVHHVDHYPEGNEAMGPDASLAGRQIGSDFAGKDGWRMYHGDVVPGFPRHPHRGFETITLARSGYIDHSDSLGATARFGTGDVQWMTAGKGIVHAEMFPLIKRDGPNPAELFQLWINLPARSKMVDPYFTMLWNDRIGKPSFFDDHGRRTEVAVICGELDGSKGPGTPPDSWAADPDAHVAVWTIRMDPNAKWTLPAGAPGLNRALYTFTGDAVRIDSLNAEGQMRIKLRSDAAVELEAGPLGTELLMLQGRPIDEPVARHGPFVMNTRTELEQAYSDYRSTRFGGWPWERDDPVHERNKTRFAIHASGKKEEPG